MFNVYNNIQFCMYSVSTIKLFVCTTLTCTKNVHTLYNKIMCFVGASSLYTYIINVIVPLIYLCNFVIHLTALYI